MRDQSRGHAGSYANLSIRCLLLGLILSWPLLGAAQVYRWVDEKGKVHYTQTPPPEGKAKGSVKEVPPAPPPSLGGAPSLGDYAKKLQTEREEREQAQAKVDQAAQRLQQNCAAAKQRKAFLDRFDGRMFNMQEDGGREAWTPERYAAEKAQIDAAIAENCK